MLNAIHEIYLAFDDKDEPFWRANINGREYQKDFHLHKPFEVQMQEFAKEIEEAEDELNKKNSSSFVDYMFNKMWG